MGMVKIYISNCAMVISHPCILFYSCTWWTWISIVEFCAMVFILDKAILIHIDCHATYAPLRIFAQWTNKKKSMHIQFKILHFVIVQKCTMQWNTCHIAFNDIDFYFVQTHSLEFSKENHNERNLETCLRFCKGKLSKTLMCS